MGGRDPGEAKQQEREKQQERDQIVHRFHRALQRGDFAAMAAIFKAARGDASLEHMLVAYNEALAGALASEPSSSRPPVHEAPSRPMAPAKRAVRESSAPYSSAPRVTRGRHHTQESAAARGSARAAAAYILTAAREASGLRVPDDPGWRGAHAYSIEVAHDLRSIFGSLRLANERTSDLTSYAEMSHLRHSDIIQLINFLQALLDNPMAAQQRIRACFVCAVLLMERAGQYDNADPLLQHHLDQALTHLHTAIDLAEGMKAFGDAADLLYLRSKIYRRRSELRRAAGDLADCLTLLRGGQPGGQLGPPRDPSARPALSAGSAQRDVAFEMSVLTHLASYEFFLAHYDYAECHNDEARLLIPGSHANAVESAEVEWLQALLYRWRGEPERALRPAVAAADLYAKSDLQGSSARIEVVVAEIALDMAECFEQRIDRLAFAEFARPHIEKARERAPAASDPPGAALAGLAMVRYDRVSGQEDSRQESRIARLEAIERQAKRLGDDALHIQALTALGDEWMAQAQNEGDGAGPCAVLANRGVAYHREAVALAEQADLPALGAWSKRTLLKSDEQALKR